MKAEVDAINARVSPWVFQIAENKGKVADWSFPWVCGNCTEPKFKTN